MKIKPALAALAAAALCSCSLTIEATLEVTTTAVETVARRASVALHPRGDAVVVAAGASEASVFVAGQGSFPAGPGSRVELAVVENELPAGASSKLTIDGRQVHSSGGRIEVGVSWVEYSVRALPPKTENVPLEIEPGESEEVDLTVMYAPMPDSRLDNVKTEVRLKGPDAGRLRWVESEPPVLGRVRGRVEAPRKAD